MSRQELRRRLLLADPTARDADLIYGPETNDDGTADEAEASETAEEEATPAEGQD